MRPSERPVWIFDLDDTLHHATPHIFPHINRSMTAWLMQHLHLDEVEANRVRVDYWHRYGATLTGLMRHHGTNPHHFLRETHDVNDLAPRARAVRGVRPLLRRLRGRKILFTNGPHHYARAILRQLRLGGLFDAVVGIEGMGFHPKPQLPGYRRLLQRQRLVARRCILVDDSHANIRTAHRLGMGGVWLSPRHSHNSRVPRIAHLGHLARRRRVR